MGVGSEQIWKFSFTDAGRINEKPGKEPASKTGGSIRRGFSLFGPAKEEPQKETHLTAEWIEYEICVPGEPVRKIRRQVFDLVGPAERQEGEASKTIKITEQRRLERGLALLGETQILLQVCNLSAEFFTHLMAKNLLANREILPELLRQGDLLKHRDSTDQLSKLTPLPGPEYSLALARGEWSRLRGCFCLNRPNILSAHSRLRQDQEDELVPCSAFDIVANEVAISSAAEINPFLVPLEQGVLDTNVEVFLLKEPCGKVENTGEMFARAIAQGTNWLAIRDPHDKALRQLKLPKDSLSRIQQELAAGYIVLVPKKKVLMEDRAFGGWWRLNPSTGHVLGMGQDGTGQGQVTYSMLLEHTFFGLGGFIGCMISAASADDPASQRAAIVVCLSGAFMTGFGIFGIHPFDLFMSSLVALFYNIVGTYWGGFGYRQ